VGVLRIQGFLLRVHEKLQIGFKNIWSQIILNVGSNRAGTCIEVRLCLTKRGADTSEDGNHRIATVFAGFNSY
jgi:hypothetical protein